jgi:hypothetical protein
MQIDLNSLSSRVVRRQVTGGTNGIRRFAVSGFGQLTQGNGNVISNILSAAFKFGAFIIGSIVGLIFRGIGITWSFLWGLFLRGKNFIWHFNWNATDEDLDKEVKQKIDALGGVLGSTIGTVVGQLLGGVVLIGGIMLFKFSMPLAIYLLKASGPEVLQEVAASIATLLRSLVAVASQAIFTNLYKNIRRKITGGVREKDEALLKEMEKSGKITAEKAAQIREKRDAPWSFALQQEKFVEKLPTQFLRNLAENAFEETGENFDEASMVLAEKTDEYFAVQQLIQPNPLGQERTVEILLNRATDEPQST